MLLGEFKACLVWNSKANKGHSLEIDCDLFVFFKKYKKNIAKLKKIFYNSFEIRNSS